MKFFFSFFFVTIFFLLFNFYNVIIFSLFYLLNIFFPYLTLKNKKILNSLNFFI